jgi:hypothetical protein
MSAIIRRRTKNDVSTFENIGGHVVPFYRVMLDDGNAYLVPKHIRRICDRDKSLLGWQISYKRVDVGYYSRFFHDNHSPRDSLERAIRSLRKFLLEMPATRRSGLRIREDKNKIYKTGIAGIRIYWRLGRRASIYELKIEARAGAPYSKETARNFFVGTEFSVTEESFNKALNRALAFRREKLSDAVSKGQTLPRIRGKRPRLTIDLDQAYRLLNEMKRRRAEDIEEHVRAKVESKLASRRRFSMFRNKPIKWTTKEVNGQRVKVPDFVSIDDYEWTYEYRLPNGVIYGGSLEISDDPADDIKGIVVECFTESVMATIEPPKDRLYEPTPRYASMPLAAIQAINEEAEAG